MNVLLNILWLIFGGFVSGLGWVLAGILMAINHHRHSLGALLLHAGELFLLALRSRHRLAR